MTLTKLCSTCKETKPVTQFSTDRCSRDGYQGHCRPCAVKRSRAWKQKKYYGLTLTDREKIFLDQGSVCAICGLEAQQSLDLHCDHDHRTNEVRGLLCASCNHGLGKFRDSPHLLIIAAAYLDQLQSRDG